MGIAAVSGLALQVLALRSLGDGEYATFVLALAVGNVANALAGVMQPVVAVQAHTARPQFLPLALPRIGALLLVGCLAGTLALAGSVTPPVAFAALLQVPLHVIVGVGLGRLQARRAFGRMAMCFAAWSLIRVALVVPFLLGGVASQAVFVAALPLSLLGELALIAISGGFRGIDLGVMTQGRPRLLRDYALWGLFAWLFNADALYARTVLAPAAADAYAIALTLGRQPIYLAAPLVTVLLPVTLAAAAAGQRRRLHAVIGAAAILALATVATLGPSPALVLAILTGDPASTQASYVRAYAAIGSLGAAASLLFAFVYGLGRRPSLGALLILALGHGVLGLAVARTPEQLLALQAAVSTIIVVALAAIAYLATAADYQPSFSRE